MKKMLIVIAILVLLVGGVLVLALVNANALIAAYKPELERLASNALGSKVELGDLQASIFPRVQIKVGELRVANTTPNEPALKLEDLLLRLELWPLLQKQLKITTLEISNPQITIIKDRSGTRIAGLPSSPKPAVEHSGAAVGGKESGANSPTTSQTLAIDLDSIVVRSGSLNFDDRIEGKQLRVTNVAVDADVLLANESIEIRNVRLRGNALDKADFTVEGKNIELKGSALRVPELRMEILGNVLNATTQLNLKSLKGEATLRANGVKLESLETFSDLAPQLKNLHLRGAVSPDLRVTLDGSSYDANGPVRLERVGLQVPQYMVSNLSGSIAVQAAPSMVRAETKDLGLEVNAVPLKVKLIAALQGKDAKFEGLSVQAFGGDITGRGTTRLDGSQPFSTAISIRDVDTGPLLAMMGTPTEAQKFHADLHQVEVDLVGSLKGDLLNSLRGSVAIELNDAALKGVNLVGKVLQAVKGLPFLQGPLMDAVPAAQRGEVNSADTVMSLIKGRLVLSNGKMTTNDLLAQSKLFSLNADGTVGFNGSLDLNATFLFSPEFSKALVASVKEIRNLLDGDGHVLIPLTLTGTPPALLVVPNIERLMKTTAGKVIEEKAGKFLEKALGGKGGGGGIKKLFGF